MPALMHNITDISRCAAQFRSEEMAPLGLKACHASYLAVICRTPGITQDQLARQIFINKSNVARQLAILEDDGFVERKPSPEDSGLSWSTPPRRLWTPCPPSGRCSGPGRSWWLRT